MFKYKINHFLGSLPMTVSIESFSRRLSEKHKIPEEIFLSDRFISIEENRQIPFERLQIYAHELRVPIEALYMLTHTQDQKK
jgi:hypothetical protein